MYTNLAWDIIGYEQRVVPNSFYASRTDNDRLAVVFPGFGYSAEAPLLFYIKELLFQRGNDVLSVDYSYNRNADFLKADEQTREQWFEQDVEAVYREVCRRGQYLHLTLTGKSLGTSAVHHLIRSGLKHKGTRFIWLTPGTHHAEIAKTIAALESSSLILVGTADPFYDPQDYRLAGADSRVTIEEFRNADHILAIENDVPASIENLRRCAEAVSSFLQMSSARVSEVR